MDCHMAKSPTCIDIWWPNRWHRRLGHTQQDEGLTVAGFPLCSQTCSSCLCNCTKPLAKMDGTGLRLVIVAVWEESIKARKNPKVASNLTRVLRENCEDFSVNQKPNALRMDVSLVNTLYYCVVDCRDCRFRTLQQSMRAKSTRHTKIRTAKAICYAFPFIPPYTSRLWSHMVAVLQLYAHETSTRRNKDHDWSLIQFIGYVIPIACCFVLSLVQQKSTARDWSTKIQHSCVFLQASAKLSRHLWELFS